MTLILFFFLLFDPSDIGTSWQISIFSTQQKKRFSPQFSVRLDVAQTPPTSLAYKFAVFPNRLEILSRSANLLYFKLDFF